MEDRRATALVLFHTYRREHKASLTRLLKVVRDHDHSDAQLARQLRKKPQHVGRMAGIKRSSWFVRQHDRWPVRQRRGYGDPLALTYGERCRVLPQ